VVSETVDEYWQRNNTCVEALTKIILTKMSVEELSKTRWSCHNMKDISEEVMDECWKKVEHPEWFGTSPYYIKPYLALCVKLGLGDQAYTFLNSPGAFPHVRPMPPFKVGDTVKHYLSGLGVIESIDGATAEVHFDNGSTLHVGLGDCDLAAEQRPLTIPCWKEGCTSPLKLITFPCYQCDNGHQFNGRTGERSEVLKNVQIAVRVEQPLKIDIKPPPEIVDDKEVKVSFRKIMSAPPNTESPREQDFFVDERVVTEDGDTFEVVEVRKSNIVKNQETYDYLLKTPEGNKWYHESAIDTLEPTCSFGVPVRLATQDESCVTCEKRILKGNELICIDLLPEEEEAEEQTPKSEQKRLGDYFGESKTA